MTKTEIKPDNLAEALAIVDVPYGTADLRPPVIDGWPAFGKLIPLNSTERRQLESLRNLIRRFIDQPRHVRPLCIAVFGPPGSGKSFAVKQIAGEALKESPRKLATTTINLTQLASPDELASAVATSLLSTASDAFPLLFFDEFDTARDGAPYGWLSWFLAPMHDGEFIHDGKVLSVTRAVFVFAGGTAATMEAFNARGSDGQFRNAKGPDFVSRLRGFLDVAGPNAEPRMIRRAIILRSEFERRLEKAPAAPVRIGEKLLDALLRVGRYRHGARSIAALIELSDLTEPSIGWSALPHDHLIAMQVDRGPLDRTALGGTVALSGFGPSKTGQPDARDDEGSVESGWQSVIRGLLNDGATVAFAGSWDGQNRALTSLVREELEKRPSELSADQTVRDAPLPRFHSFFAALDAATIKRVDAQMSADERKRIGIALSSADVGDLDGEHGWPNRVVERFRRRLAVTEISVARFVIGGDARPADDRLSGIVEETVLSLAWGHPIYVAGGFLGAAADLGIVLGLSSRRTGLTPGSMRDRLPNEKREQLNRIADHLRPSPFPDLPIFPDEQVAFLRAHALGTRKWPDNGLSHKENRDLFASTDPTRVKQLVVTGMLRRFGQRHLEGEVFEESPGDRPR